MIVPFRRRAEPSPRKRVSAHELFQGLLNKLGYDPDRYAIFEIWERLLGSQASKARAVGLKGRRLCVEVDSNARMHDLMLRKRSVLKKLNGHFGPPPAVSDIIFRLAAEDRRALGSHPRKAK